MTCKRTVLLVAHTGRPEAVESARAAAERLNAAGLAVRVLESEAGELALDKAEVVPVDTGSAQGCELVMVLGGDGTLLRGADLARGARTPLVGVNLGHVGFLAESERDDLDVTVEHVVDRDYTVEERMTLDVTVTHNGDTVADSWAVNEVSVEKAARERMVELVVEIDGRPLSRWAGDGVVAATPTGSTAYAFSAGGPIVWPEVEALLVVPLSAHALFARPMVVAPDSLIGVELTPPAEREGVLWCDGRRTVELPPGARIEVRRGREPVRLARLHLSPFTDRLVAKFDLPVHGWRGRRDSGAQVPSKSASAGAGGSDHAADTTGDGVDGDMGAAGDVVSADGEGATGTSTVGWRP